MNPLQGLTTVVLTATDMEAATAWYSNLIGSEPYFRRPESGTADYVEFRIGPDQDELGIMNRTFFSTAVPGEGTSITYWHVADVVETTNELIARGATLHTPIVERGGGFSTASVIDPFGNLIGLMHSPHWAEQHTERDDNRGFQPPAHP